MGKYSAMSVNERLGDAGLFSEWDQAVMQRDRDRMITILESVEVTADQAAWTADTVLANPERYGFK